MMRYLFIIPLFIILFLVGCNLGVNTTDPQASRSIEQSIKDNFFIKEYSVHGVPDSTFNITQAWAEYLWKNKIENGKAYKKRTDELQINLKIGNYLAPQLNEENYLINWQMEDTKNGYFGRSNGIYVLMLKENELPDTLTVSINLINSPDKITKQFKIFKK